MTDDYDPPMADPQIMLNYQAALGAFLVSFNALENELGRALELAIDKMGATKLAERCSEASMEQKIVYLEFLGLTREGAAAASVDLDRLRDLNRQRNALAHGHVHQNPFDGSFEQIGVRKGAFKQPISTEQLRSLHRRCEEAWDDMRHVSISFYFDDETGEDD